MNHKFLVLFLLHQILADVQDFKTGTTKVKLVDDKVVVEGKIETQEENFLSTKSFSRKFTLPDSVDFNRISSALSKDGILKVTALKKVNLHFKFS